MPNLKEIRNRITSITSTVQITSAMKMVSAAKLKKTQDSVIQVRQYFEHMKEILQSLGCTTTNTTEKFTSNGNSTTVLLIVISSNRGLCGGFNSSIIKKVYSITKNNYPDKEIKIFSLGKKAGEILSKSYSNFKQNNTICDNLDFYKIAQIMNQVISSYCKDEFYEVILVYNQFKNTLIQTILAEKLLPIELPKIFIDCDASNYIFEPHEKEILQDLVPKMLRIQLYKALLNSLASEHGARMIAMHKATDNANALKNELLLTYNKARQSAITKEILEIVGGAEAMK